MTAYIFIIVLLLSLITIYDIGGKKKGKVIWQWIVMVLLIIMAGLRYHVGADTPRYEYNFYHDIPSLEKLFNNRDSLSEPLWMLLNSICKTFSGSFIFFQLIHAIIINTLLFRFIRKTTKYVFSALLLTFIITWWNLSFEVLRESLCVVIYLNALLALKEKKYITYAFLGIIITGFHWFGFVVVIVTPIMMFFSVKRTLPVAIIMVVVLFLYVDTMFFDMLEFLASDFFEGGTQHQMNAYLSKEGEEGIVEHNIFGILRIFIVSVLFPLMTILYNKEEDSSKNFSKILILFVIIGVLQTKIVIFARFFNYLYIVLIVCVVNILFDNKIRIPVYRYFYKMVLLVYIINSCLSFYMPRLSESRTNIHYNCYLIPYKTVFEDPDPTREYVY